MSKDALFQDVIRKRRSVRKFEPGRSVSRDALQRIVDCGRWAPLGANVQCWDFIVVEEPAMRDGVMAVFLRQAQRLVDHAKGFPAVKKTYLANTIAIIFVLSDPRWKACFPQATNEEWNAEYRANNEAIFLCSLGAAVQNIQIGVAAEGLTSAWLSGGAENEINRELAGVLESLWHNSDQLSGDRSESPLPAASRSIAALETAISHTNTVRARKSTSMRARFVPSPCIATKSP